MLHDGLLCLCLSQRNRIEIDSACIEFCLSNGRFWDMHRLTVNQIVKGARNGRVNEKDIERLTFHIQRILVQKIDLKLTTQSYSSWWVARVAQRDNHLSRWSNFISEKIWISRDWTELVHSTVSPTLQWLCRSFIGLVWHNIMWMFTLASFDLSHATTAAATPSTRNCLMGAVLR